MPLSGSEWVNQFPTSHSLDDLADAFRDKAKQFVDALKQAQASVIIDATLRPPQRAYLMHYSFAVAREALDPTTVPPMDGVDVQWDHDDPAASKAAAEQMVRGYGIVFKPVLVSRHSQGLAMDITVTWQNDLVISDGNGATVTISSVPRTGAGNPDLHKLGATYGVIKLATDAPHWSSDGH